MKYGGCNLSLTAPQATKPLTYGLRTFMNHKPMDAAPAARVSGTERPMSFQIHGPRTAFPNLAGIGRTWDVFFAAPRC